MPAYKNGCYHIHHNPDPDCPYWSVEVWSDINDQGKGFPCETTHRFNNQPSQGVCEDLIDKLQSEGVPDGQSKSAGPCQPC